MNFSITSNINISNLVKIEYYSGQRPIDREYIKNITSRALRYYQDNNQPLIRQSISICDLNGKKMIIDGQHRAECFKQLLKNNHPDYCIHTPIYTCKSMEDVDKLFKYLNSYLPMPHAYICDAKSLTGPLLTYLKSTYPSYMRDTVKCQRPNISIKTLNDYISSTDWAQRLLNIGITSNELIDAVKLLNNQLLETKVDDFNRLSSCQMKSLSMNDTKKIKKGEAKLGLGIFRRFEWLTIIEGYLSGYIDFINVDFIWKNFDQNRRILNSELKSHVWERRNGKFKDGQCYVCDEKLSYSDFECGHVVPFCLGGTTDLDNLEPICTKCNRKMGICNLLDYKKVNYI